MTRPGSIFILNQEDLKLLQIEKETLSNLISFLKFDETVIKNKTFYYSDDSEYLRRPIIQLNENELLFPNGKFILETFYKRINFKLIEKKSTHSTKTKCLNKRH